MYIAHKSTHNFLKMTTFDNYFSMEHIFIQTNSRIHTSITLMARYTQTNETHH
jgi:hypothetical protein